MWILARDKAVLGQMVWVSESYAKENRYSVTQEELENGIYNGGKEYSVWYKNLWNLEKKTENISKAAGFTKDGTGMEVNPAYNLLEEDSFSFSSLIVMILFVILAGYLIIYNIFQISVKTDIRVYGLLKNVGTTGKQLKKNCAYAGVEIVSSGHSNRIALWLPCRALYGSVADRGC